MNDLYIYIPAIGIFCLILSIYKLFFEQRVQAQENIIEVLEQNRLRQYSKSALQEEIVLKQRNKNKKSLRYLLEMKLELANMVLKPNEFILISMAVGASLFVLFFISGQGLFGSLIPGLLGLVAPYGYVLVRIWLRMKAASQQFPDVIDTMVNCFKTGYGMNRALQVVADKFKDPWGTEFDKIITEINLGLSLEEALENLHERVPNPDVELFVAALLIQRESGGNLGELLGNLSRTCRARHQFFRTVKSISAQGKLSAGIVACVPFFLMLMMYSLLPQAVIDFVTNPIGIVLMILVSIWMLMGFGVLYKTVQIEV